MGMVVIRNRQALIDLRLRNAIDLSDCQDSSNRRRAFPQAPRSTPATTVSALANNAGSMVRDEAAAFSSSWAGRLTPTIAEATFGSRSTQARANWESVQPASRAIGFRFWTASSTGWVSQVCIITPMVSLVARESAGDAAPGGYLPESTPWASGDQTICETPLAAQSGMTFSSGRRHSREYCGWLETKRSTPGVAKAASIWAGDHSEKPIWRALPWRTTSLSASMVSANGVAGS